MNFPSATVANSSTWSRTEEGLTSRQTHYRSYWGYSSTSSYVCTCTTYRVALENKTWKNSCSWSMQHAVQCL